MSSHPKNLPEPVQTSPDPRPKRRGCRRFLFFAAAVAVAAVVALALLTTLEAPRRGLIERVAGRTLGADVTVRGVRLRPPFGVAHLQIAQPGAETPVLEAHGISLDYRIALPSEGVRLFPEVRVDEVRLRLHETAPDETNFAFFTALLQRPPEDEPRDMLPYIPRRIVIDRVSMEIRQADAALHVGDAAAEASVEALERFTVEVRADDLSGHFERTSPPVSESFTGGGVGARVQRSADGWDVQLDRLDLPGLVQARAAAALYREADGFRVTASVSEAQAGPLPTAPIARFFGLPAVRFDALLVENMDVDVTFGAEVWTVRGASANATVSNLEIGDEGQRWYAGDLAVQAALDDRDEPALTINAVLARGQEITGRAALEGGAVRARAVISDWSREDLAQAIPEAHRTLLDYLPGLERLTGEAEARVAQGAYDATLRGKAVLAAESVAFDVSGDGRYTGDDAPSFDGAARAALAGGAVDVVMTLHGAGLDARATLDGLRAAEWSAALGNGAFPELPAMHLDGSVELRGTWDAVEADVDLIADTFLWGAMSLEEGETLAATGTIAWDVPARGLTAESIALAVRPEPAATVAVTGAALSLVDYAISAHAAGALDLAWAGAKRDLPDLWGEADFQMPLRIEGGGIHATFEAEASSFGYGDLTIPYGTALEVSGSAVYDAPEGALRGERLVATVGEGTRAVSDAWAVTVAPAMQGSIPFRIVSDFVPIVAMAYLDEAEGVIEAEGALHIIPDNSRIEAEVEAVASHLMLPDAFALLTDARFAGRVGYGTALFGEGNASAAQMVIAGAVIRDIAGPVVFDGDRVLAEDVSGVLFDGQFTAGVTAGVFQDKQPITISARGTGLDLGLFTEQVQPPRVTLTGLAEAEAYLLVNEDGLQDVRVEAHASDGLTVNRDIMRQVLMSQYMAGVAGARQLDRIVDSVLGPAPQRPFDSGALDLILEAGRLTGEARLRSDALNLTIDLRVDPEALVAAMKLSAEQLQGIEGITSGPIEWGD